MILRLIAPIGISNVGFRNSPNGSKYGWGFRPHGIVRIENPDNGNISYDRINNHGWRDRSRTYLNRKNSFRVIVLGDSEVFGFIVPEKRMFTRILEDRFKDEGANVEIINISYSGWSTSQQLEALEKEGMKYKPDVVVVNFCENDLVENSIHLDKSKFATRIPFFHQVSADGKLVRRDNPRFAVEQNLFSRKYLLSKFEILKRLWLIRLFLKDLKKKKHIFASGQKLLIRLALFESHLNSSLEKIPKDFELELENMRNHEMTLSELKFFLNRFELSEKTQKGIIRITNNLDFLREFNGTGFYDVLKISSYNWNLYTHLMRKMRSIAQHGNAELVLTTDRGQGGLNWQRYWFAAPQGDTGRKSYFMMTEKLKSFSKTNGIMFADPSKNDQRAMNDPHLNEDGHRAKAQNLYNFLMKNFKKEIQAR